MAEVFGVAASAVGIASVVLDMAKSIEKLKNFCEDVRTAPQDIEEFAQEVNDIGILLAQLEDFGILQQSACTQSFQLCFSHCQRANKYLSTVTTELQRTLKDHGWRTRLQFPLKKERLNQLTDKLERSKSSLSLACQVYGMWFSREHTQLQEQLLRDMMVLMQTQQVQTNSQLQTSKSASRLAPHECSSADWQMSRIVWDACVQQFARGWKRYFRHYQVLRFGHPALESCRKGDLLGLQRQLCTGQIGIHDRNTFGTTLFMTSIENGHMHIARELHQMGADVTATDNFGQSGLDVGWTYMRFPRGRSMFCDFDEVRRSLKFLVDDCALEPESEDLGLSIERLSKPSSVWAGQDLFSVAEDFAGNDSVMSFVLQNSRDNSIWCMRNTRGWTVMHQYAWVSGCGGLTKHLSPGQSPIIPSAILGGSDLHALPATDDGASGWGTPLRTFLRALVPLVPSSHYEDEVLTCALQGWVSAVADAGIDLGVYGAKESAVWKAVPKTSTWYRRIIGFTFGRNVEDWKVLAEHPGDVYAGDFWHSIENPETHVPGAWVEPSRGVWDDDYYWWRRHMRKVERKALQHDDDDDE